jgi:hypothetical protein
VRPTRPAGSPTRTCGGLRPPASRCRRRPGARARRAPAGPGRAPGGRRAARAAGPGARAAGEHAARARGARAGRGRRRPGREVVRGVPRRGGGGLAHAGSRGGLPRRVAPPGTARPDAAAGGARRPAGRARDGRRRAPRRARRARDRPGAAGGGAAGAAHEPPGMGRAVRWQEEHGGAIDLVAYLAMRATYAAVLREHGDDDAPAAPPGSDTRPATPEARAARVAELLGGAATPAQQARPRRSSAGSGSASVPSSGSRPTRRTTATGCWACSTATRRRPRRAAVRAGRLLHRRALGGPPAPPRGDRPVRDARLRGASSRWPSRSRRSRAGSRARSAPCCSSRGTRPRARGRRRRAPGAAPPRGPPGARGRPRRLPGGKDDGLAPFALAEASGWVAGPDAAARTFLAGPTGRCATAWSSTRRPSSPPTWTSSGRSRATSASPSRTSR